MSGEFAIQWLPSTAVLAIRVSGFWSESSVTDFERALDETTRGLPQGQSRIKRVFVDAREVQVQQQPIVQALQNVLSAKLARDCRVAVVAAGALQKAQARRVNSQVLHVSFDSESDAMAWLSEPVIS